jgi:hypothetical protein
MGAGLVQGLTGSRSSVAAAASGLLGVGITPPNATAGALGQLGAALQSQVAPVIRVFIGDREITDIVRTEVTNTNRATRRTVTAGAGTTF